MNETYIAAVELGSSKIMGAVGKYSSDGTLKVLTIDQEESRDSIRYGIIQNPEEVAMRVNRIIERLNAHPAIAPKRITGIYVGLSGRSMHSVMSNVELTFPEETEVTGEMISRLRQDAMEVELDSNQEILATEDRSYQIDGLETFSPKGAMGKQISATYDLIIGRTELKRNIKRALSERTGLDLKGLIITPLATADIVLSDEEKRLGCMLVDLGAETTSVSIYRKGALCYFATLPMGGRNITRDLTTLNILEERAEEIKCESGRAVPRETPSALTINDIKLSEVSNLVVARAEEIVANIVQQIEYAGLKVKDLPGGIVAVGAGANLNGILELMEHQSSLNARMGHIPSYIQALEPRAKRYDTIQTCAILYSGALRDEDSCLESPLTTDDVPEEEIKPEPVSVKTQEGKMGKFFRNVSNKVSNFFAGPADEDSELD